MEDDHLKSTVKTFNTLCEIEPAEPITHHTLYLMCKLRLLSSHTDTHPPTPSHRPASLYTKLYIHLIISFPGYEPPFKCIEMNSIYHDV